MYKALRDYLAQDIKSALSLCLAVFNYHYSIVSISMSAAFGKGSKSPAIRNDRVEHHDLSTKLLHGIY